MNLKTNIGLLNRHTPVVSQQGPMIHSITGEPQQHASSLSNCNFSLYRLYVTKPQG